MSTLSVNAILSNNGFAALSEFSGLSKNLRKRRNAKIKHAAQHGGAGGISALLSSGEFSAYIDPACFNKKPQMQKISAPISRLPGMSDATGPCGGWGRLPNVSQIDYADDDPRGWVHVGRNKRNRSCRIQDDDYYEA